MRGSLSNYANQAVKEIFMKIIMLENVGCYTLRFNWYIQVSHSTLTPTFLRLISLKMATLREMTSNFQKLDKFEGVGFRQWQKKMHFLLTTLKVVYVLNTTYP